jgi:hypothetical protein
MPQCPTCGTAYTGNFCPTCGARALQAEPGGYAPQPVPYQPPVYPGAEAQPRKSGFTRAVRIISTTVFVIGLILVILVYIGNNGPTISTPVIATQFDRASGEVPATQATVPANSPIIYALVQVKTKDQATVLAKWYLNGEHLAQVDTTRDLPKKYEDWLAFQISNNNAWPAGTYRVEFYLSGEKQSEQTFHIQ